MALLAGIERASKAMRDAEAVHLLLRCVQAEADREPLQGVFGEAFIDSHAGVHHEAFLASDIEQFTEEFTEVFRE